MSIDLDRAAKWSVAAFAATLCLLALPTLAAAHITITPSQAPAGSFAGLAVRVPTESSSASTTKVALQMPPGVLSASYEPVSGWSTVVKKNRLTKPIETDDGPIDEQITEVVWTATGPGIAPGQFVSFGLSVLLPKMAGQTLPFKAVQTYSNGDVVRWIGPPGASEPAPTLTLTASEMAGASMHGGGHKAGSASTDEHSDSSGSGEDVAFIALGVAVFALIASIWTLVLVRRGRN